MRIVIENAGAQKSYLLLPKDGKYLIEAEGDVNKEETNILKSIEIISDILPLSMINYVIHSKDSIVLDNATQSDRFNMDPYVVFQTTEIRIMYAIIEPRCLIRNSLFRE